MPKSAMMVSEGPWYKRMFSGLSKHPTSHLKTLAGKKGGVTQDFQDNRGTKPKKPLPTGNSQLDIFVDASYFVFYAMSNFQDLGICHQS
jgi:hypothetical protein